MFNHDQVSDRPISSLLLHALRHHVRSQAIHSTGPDLLALDAAQVLGVAVRPEPVDGTHPPARELHHVIVEHRLQCAATVGNGKRNLVDRPVHHAEVPEAAKLIGHNGVPP